MKKHLSNEVIHGVDTLLEKRVDVIIARLGRLQRGDSAAEAIPITITNRLILFNSNSLTVLIIYYFFLQKPIVRQDARQDLLQQAKSTTTRERANDLKRQ